MSTQPEIAAAPDKNTYIIAALILVPIAIAGVAAFVAIKTTDILSSAKRFIACSPFTACVRGRKLKHNKSSETLHQTDSFYDLESVQSASSPQRKREPVVEESLLESGKNKQWNPSRSARLAWSFGRNSKQTLKYQNPYESTNALVPTQPQMVALRADREISLSQDDTRLAQEFPPVHSRRDHSDA